MPVDYGITPEDLAQSIKNFLLQPLTKLCPGFPWDLSGSEVRASGIWQDILKNRRLDIPYFEGRFLKAKSGKAAGTFAFAPPAKPVKFVLIIERDQWMDSERFMEEPGYIPVCIDT